MYRDQVRFGIETVKSAPSEASLRPRLCCAPDCGALFWVCSHCDRGQRYYSQAYRNGRSAAATACGQPPLSARGARQTGSRSSPASLSVPALSSPRDGSRFPIDPGAGRGQPGCPSQVLHLWLSQPLGRSVLQASASAQSPISEETAGRGSRLRSYVIANTPYKPGPFYPAAHCKSRLSSLAKFTG